MNTVHYTYVYLRPDGSAYYVGQGVGYRAFSTHHRVPVPLKDLILLEAHTSKADALEAEAFLISFWGREDLGLGRVINLTDGGEVGPNGCKHKPGTYSERAEKRRGKKRGPIHSEEARKKISEANKRRDPATFAKSVVAMSNYWKGRHLTDEHKEKVAAPQRGRVFTVEHRQKMSEARKGKSPWNKGLKFRNSANVKGSGNYQKNLVKVPVSRPGFAEMYPPDVVTNPQENKGQVPRQSGLTLSGVPVPKKNSQDNEGAGFSFHKNIIVPGQTLVN